LSVGRRTIALLSAGISALLLIAGAPANAQTTPKLSGAYTLKIRKYCQPLFSGQQANDPQDGDAQSTEFFFPGSIKDQIGVVNFNPTTHTVSGSMIKIAGAVTFQDLTALGISTTNQPFTTSSKSIAGTFSTTATSFTVDTGDGANTFQAVYGAFSGSVAHAVLFANTSTDGNGDSCVESGELQFK
jgi:hypothetical protein